MKKTKNRNLTSDPIDTQYKVNYGINPDGTPFRRQFNRVELNDNAKIPVMAGRLEPELLEQLKKEILALRDNNPEPYNRGLAGAIKEEYLFDAFKVEGLVSYINEMYANYSTHFKLNVGKMAWLSQLWANFQKKHEFNPVHNHTGAASFVIWVQVPYDLAEEAKITPSGTVNVTSQFQFVYPGIREKTMVYNFPVSKEWEGTIIMFPSWLMHTVYPFYTSDDYRISLAGNLFVLGANYKTNPTDDPDKFIRESLKIIEEEKRQALANTNNGV